MLGVDFTVNASGYVTGIGAFYDTSNGQGFGGQTIPVAIYNVGTHSMVAGTEVDFTGTPVAGDVINNNYWFRSITPVFLGSGTTYSIVAANYGVTGGKQDINVGKAPYSYGSTPLTFDTVGGALTVSGARQGTGASLVFPVSGFNLPGLNPFFGAGSFDFTPVPEVAAFGATAVGLLGLVYIGRHVVLRRGRKLA